MQKLSLSLYLFFLITTYSDMMTSLFAAQCGYIESNPLSLYHIVDGNSFWAIYLIVSAGMMVILMLAEQKYPWVSVITLILSIPHLLCTINNIGQVI